MSKVLAIRARGICEHPVKGNLNMSLKTETVHWFAEWRSLREPEKSADFSGTAPQTAPFEQKTDSDSEKTRHFSVSRNTSLLYHFT